MNGMASMAKVGKALAQLVRVLVGAVELTGAEDVTTTEDVVGTEEVAGAEVVTGTEELAGTEELPRPEGVQIGTTRGSSAKQCTGKVLPLPKLSDMLCVPHPTSTLYTPAEHDSTLVVVIWHTNGKYPF